jgi:hypothetical protein
VSAQKSRLTHITFFKVCEVLRTHRERFLKERPTDRKAAEMLTELSKIQVSENSVSEIKEASEVTWERKKAGPKLERSKALTMQRQACRTLARAVKLLYRKFDEELPSALANLCDFYDGKIETIDLEEEKVEQK